MPAPSLSDFISSAKFLVLIVFIINFAFPAVSSENFLTCTIFCSTFQQAILFLVFRFHFQKARAIFRKYLALNACIFCCI